MRNIWCLMFIMCWSQVVVGQAFQGVVRDKSSDLPLAGVSVELVEDGLTALTDENGLFTFDVNDDTGKSIRFWLPGYMFEDQYNVLPSDQLVILLRPMIKSAATLREEEYLLEGCDPDIPNDPEWNASFEESELLGDLAPNSTYTRRDPSAVIQVDGKYYVWYSYSLTFDETKTAPWDRNDIYYATSEDGITWEEHGAAVARGEEGSFDARSVFTTEIFVDSGKYYLVYQAAGDQSGIYDRNVVGMAHADSPDGPWTKLSEPVLRPSYTNDLVFDNNAVHDPCIINYQGQYHLYFKGECNCMGAAGCTTWCNPVCGLGKQVKWGVAVADSPTGPFTKSAMNPITNTGHEVMVWPYEDGVAILQHQDGPEAQTIQFAEDGFNFEIKGSVSNIPEAAGLYRPNEPGTRPHDGIQWGLSHVLRWDAGNWGWMYIRRFDLKNVQATGMRVRPDTILMNVGDTRSIEPTFEPSDATNTAFEVESSSPSVVEVNPTGDFEAKALGFATLTVIALAGEFKDEVVVKVTEKQIGTASLRIEAEDFLTTDHPNGQDYGGPVGMNRTGIGVNFVNRDDWATYEVMVPWTGHYFVNYLISTPSDDAEVSIVKDETLLNAQPVINNGGWDNYYNLPGDNSFYMEKGTQELTLIASGTNDWQWNMDAFILSSELEIETDLSAIGFDSDTIRIVLGASNPLVAMLDPEEAENVILEWQSDQPDVAIVEDGVVEALSLGTAVISATDTNTGITGSVVVQVIEDPSIIALTGLSFTVDEFTVPVDTSFLLELVMEPDDATNLDLSWTSSDEVIAEITDGQVITRNPGTALIQVMDLLTGISASATIKVLEPQPLSVDDGSVAVAIFPNPATNRVLVSGSVSEIRLYDSNGRFRDVLINKESTVHEVDISNLSRGMYFLQYQLLGQIGMSRIIKL